MKKILAYFIFSLFLSPALIGQQQQLYTQFMYNKLAINPAYAGYQKGVALTGIYRNQWIGLLGAPKTQAFSFQAPLKSQKVGLGFNIVRHEIGISESLTLDGIYAYKISLGKGTLQLGVQGSARNLKVDYTNSSVITIQNINIDNGVQGGVDTKSFFNVGAGLYYHTDQFYFGLSAPRMIAADIDFDDNDLFIDRETQHFFGMAGFVLNVNKDIAFVPQLLVKYERNAPLDIDLNASLRFFDKFTFGSTFRMGGSLPSVGESIDVLFSAKVTNSMMLGFAYDFTLSELRNYSNGSLEIVARYLFNTSTEQGKFVNPRYF